MSKRIGGCACGRRSTVVSVAAGFVWKRVEDPECALAKLHSEPHGGGRFGVGQGQRSRQQFRDRCLFPGLDFQTSEKTYLNHLTPLSLYVVNVNEPEAAARVRFDPPAAPSA